MSTQPASVRAVPCAIESLDAPSVHAPSAHAGPRDGLRAALRSLLHRLSLANQRLESAAFALSRGSRLRPATVATLFDEVIRELREPAARKRVTLCTELVAALREARVNAASLRGPLHESVLSTLADLPHGSALTLRGRMCGSRIELEVAAVVCTGSDPTPRAVDFARV